MTLRCKELVPGGEHQTGDVGSIAPKLWRSPQPTGVGERRDESDQREEGCREGSAIGCKTYFVVE